MLDVSRLHKHYGTTVALDGCTFSVAPGQMLGLLGPNGAGKTTVMRAIFDLVRPERGSIKWNGRPLDQATRRHFGYMPEERGLYPKLPVRWQLRYLARLHGMLRSDAEEAVEGWLERFGLADRGDANLRELSHGNQQRVQLIASLVHDPVAVALDEPFSGLDPIASSTMADVLLEVAARGTAVLFSSHQLDVVEDLCRDVVILDHGRVVLQGQVMELRASAPERYVEVAGAPRDWALRIPGAEVVRQADGRVRVRLPGSVAPADVAAIFSEEVSEFRFEPPPLSEVFRAAVRP